jgi:hypothetical protein
MLKTFIVEYTNQELIGNQVLSFEVDAEDIDECYDILDDMYAHVEVSDVYLKGTGYVS